MAIRALVHSVVFFFFFSSRRRHTRCSRDWSSDLCSSDLVADGTPVTLTATDTSVVRTFQGWAGDTVTKNLSVTLPMGRPYSVRAVFLETFNTVDVVSQLLRSEEHTSELQSRLHLVCRLLLEKKKYDT